MTNYSRKQSEVPVFRDLLTNTAGRSIPLLVRLQSTNGTPNPKLLFCHHNELLLKSRVDRGKALNRQEGRKIQAKGWRGGRETPQRRMKSAHPLAEGVTQLRSPNAVEDDARGRLKKQIMIVFLGPVFCSCHYRPGM